MKKISAITKKVLSRMPPVKHILRLVMAYIKEHYDVGVETIE